MDSLPTELLQTIGEMCCWASGDEYVFREEPDFFDPYASHLAAFVLVNRRFHATLNPVLYRIHIDATEKLMHNYMKPRWRQICTMKEGDMGSHSSRRPLKPGVWTTPLHIATERGDNQLVIALTDDGADVHKGARGICKCSDPRSGDLYFKGRDVYPLHTAMLHCTQNFISRRLTWKGAWLMAEDCPAIDHVARCGREYLRKSLELNAMAHATGWDFAMIDRALRQRVLDLDTIRVCSTVYHQACRNGRTEVVSRLLQHPVFYHIDGRAPDTGFDLAANSGHFDVCQLLLDYHVAKVKTEGGILTTPLCTWRHDQGDLEIIQIFLNRRELGVVGRDVDKTSGILVDTMRKSEVDRYRDVISELIHRSNIAESAPAPGAYVWLFDIAIRHRQPHAARRLLELGADPFVYERRHGVGSTIRGCVLSKMTGPARHSVWAAQSPLLKELISRGLDMGEGPLKYDELTDNEKDERLVAKGTTLFFAATRGVNPDCVRDLLEAGARVDRSCINLGTGFSDVKPGDEQPFLMGVFRHEWCFMFDHHSELIVSQPFWARLRLLVEAGARLDPCGPGLSALEWACQVAASGNFEVLTCLLRELRNQDEAARAHLERVRREYSMVIDDTDEDRLSNRAEITQMLSTYLTQLSDLYPI